ncbi:hypothetical protein EYC98_11865 [Halieaceae bacterium IMCC14734]|uniref:Uncharacterized protein n=1 Tax=Candidatus Litorirhabdus singularis TaxID=2518993 RepID=A0ABT3TGZ7_9GAMM|nr:hypothetical protein [Candidatus Litorirhabdus singularis]MCX2981558.1 hypothetical protein [Candidatus Litorirhabdus singularis]
MLAKQHIQKWAEEGFLFIRSVDGHVRRVGFESIDHSKHMATQTGYQAFIQRRDGKNFGIVFTNSVTVDCRFNAPTAFIPNGDPEQAWWVFPPTHQDDGRRIVAFSKSR